MNVTSNNRSLSGGVNTRTAGRLLETNEATALENADISTPGLRTKRLEPEPVVTLVLSDIPVQTICPTTVQVPPVEVFWVDGVGESGYRVELFGGAGCVPSQLIFVSPDLPVNTTSFIIPASAFFSILNEYSWHVIALGNGSTTEDTTSDCCLLTIGTSVPPCVDLGVSTLLAPIDGVDILCNPVEFSWTAVPNAVGYIVRIFVSGSTTPAHESPVLPASQTNYSQTLVLGQSYQWTVQAIGDGQVWCNGPETDPEVFGANCVYTINGTIVIGPCGSGLASVHVDTNGPTCPWTAATATAWITLTGQVTGTGDGDVPFSVSDNLTGADRVGTITAGGQTHTVTQTACVFTRLPTTAFFTSAAGSGSFELTATDTCCAWTAVSNAAWLVVDAGDLTGSGTDTIDYTVSANGTGSQRVGTITVAGVTHVVTQDPPDQPDFLADILHWYDLEGNGNDLIGNADFTESISVVAGKVNNGGVFDGSNKLRAQTADMNDIVSNNWTVEGWVNLTNHSIQRTIVALDDNGNPGFLYVYVSQGYGSIVCDFGASGGQLIQALPITLGSWVHFAVTHDGTTGKLYIDGVLDDTEVAASNIGGWGATYNLYIGAQHPGSANYWLGMIDELTFYRRHLTAAEVLSIYNAQGAGKVRPP